jgi:C4-dicarboxylate-specific signal transduction histidine kinase
VDLGALARAPGDLWSGNPVAMAAFAPLGARDAMVIPLARAIRDAAGDFAGVAVALIDLAHLDTVARQSVRALEAVASIHAPDGRLMASSDRDGADRGSMAPPPWFLRGGIAPGGTGSFTGSDGRGRSLTASIAITRRIPLVVEVHKTTETVQSHTREHVVIYATTVGIVTLAALALVGVLARRRYLSATAQASLQALLADQRRNHAELQVLIAAMPGTLMRIALAANGGWRSTYVAPSFASLTGSPAHQIGSDWLAVRSAAAAAAAFDDALREAATEGEASVEFLLRHADGSDRRLAVRMTAGAQAEDHAEVISIWSDVTRERELERQLGHANKMAQLGEVATGVAHELNQPLATMSMAAENAISLLPRLPGSAERLRAKLETVVAMTTRARDVVDHMRIFGRIDTAAAAPVDLERVVRNARELVAERLRRADVSAIMCFQPDLPLVPAKEVPLEQVIINLLANACDAYIARAQPGPRPVTIVSAVEPGWVVLTIHDRAGGIPPDIIERIFEPFFTTKPVGKGTGLGLSLSFGIVADLGGVLSAANRDGGALFTIRLPLGRLP